MIYTYKFVLRGSKIIMDMEMKYVLYSNMYKHFDIMRSRQAAGMKNIDSNSELSCKARLMTWPIDVCLIFTSTVDFIEFF